MNSSIRQRSTGAVAAAAASVVTLGLVSAPPQGYEPLITRTEFAAIQLQAAVSTQAAALAGATATPPSAAAAADAVTDIPLPSLSFNGGSGLQAIATAALTLALTPLWYLAFPVTLPVAVIGGAILVNGFNSIPFGNTTIFGALFGALGPIGASLVGAALGLGAFAVGPLALIVGSLQSVFNNPLVSVVTQLPASSADSTPAADLSTTAAASQAQAIETETPTATTQPVGSPRKPARGALQRQTAIARPASAARATAAVAEPATEMSDTFVGTPPVGVQPVSTPPVGAQLESTRSVGTQRASRSASTGRDNTRGTEGRSSRR